MLYRFITDLAIPSAVYEAIPLATRTAIRDKFRQLKSYAVKINEEMTTKAVWHKCYHDEGKPCEPEQEI